MKLPFTVLCVLCTAGVFVVLKLLGKASQRTHFSITSTQNDKEFGTVVVKGATTELEPLILMYNTLYQQWDWDSSWINVGRSNAVYSLQGCQGKCHFTFDRYLQRFADLVLVSLAGYERYEDRP